MNIFSGTGSPGLFWIKEPKWAVVVVVVVVVVVHLCAVCRCHLQEANDYPPA